MLIYIILDEKDQRKMTELKTTIHHESGRIDKVLTNLFTDYSRSQIQLWLKMERFLSMDSQSKQITK